ncbi:MAG: V-type ATPase subunit [Sedimentisphaerales bacterium]|nr:V-type ATPase subunit [Sedimentisphaerales bacterium]
MIRTAEQPVLDFYMYPPVGEDDWRYTFQTAQVRALETRMLGRTVLQNMAEAENFEQAVDLLAGDEYALPHHSKSFAEVENVLLLRRSAVRKLFEELMIDRQVVELFKSRCDFANLKLALRRMLTEKPLGTDYSNDGNVPPEVLEQVLGDENYGLFPDYMAEATEQAVLAYYQNKDIRRIDYAIDWLQAKYNLRKARQLKSLFLIGLFRIQIDLTNIRTMLRLKFTESEYRDVFLSGGFIELERFEKALDTDYESQGQLFLVLPYSRVVETGAAYVASDKSFLRLEQQCDDYLTGFLKTTAQITAGPQPVIAYLLMKENEIRNVRLILTAKKNFLDTKLILDRIS